MDKKGAALVFGLLIIFVFMVMLGSFFLTTMNENNLSRRYVNSVKAFWLAEAGIAEGLYHLPLGTAGCIETNNCYDVNVSNLTGLYYQIDSTGTVTLPRLAGQDEVISRRLRAVAKTNAIDPSKFQYAIETTVHLVIRGSVDINPSDSKKEYSVLDFPDLFGYSKEDIRSFATNYYSDPAVDITPVDGITWVDVSPGNEFRIASDTWSGSGILVVAGDAQITGGTFSGIIYVIGELRLSGNPVINGTVLAESDTEIVEDTTMTGNVTLNYDIAAITDALSSLQFLHPEVVSWQEL
ncbi:MAG: hypothetical protein C4533_04375 [Candidatus Omnitrophota bacterium]|jgi:cytoskeletal protein CcmA (bactofilin family)|nr:MAG: hypothetical protein C4533_04375 [Candidatus Omnitrophota bacterium]